MNTSQDLRYVDDYFVPQAPQSDEVSEELEGFDEGFEDSGSLEDMGQTQDPKSYAEELSVLQQKISTSQLPEEFRQKELEKLSELNSLLSTLSPDKESDLEEKLSTLEDEVSNGLSHQGDMAKSAQALDDAEKQVKASPSLSKEDKDLYLKQIGQARDQLMSDPETNVQEEFPDLFVALDGDKKKTEAIKAEAERSKGKGEAMASNMDKLFQAEGGIRTDDSNTGEDLVGIATGAGAGALIGASTVSFAGYTIAALGGPIAWGIGGAILTVALLSETDAPQSKLTNLPKPFQDLDLVMHGESKLGGSRVPGDLVQTLYDSKKTGPEIVEALKQELSELPLASQSLVLSLVAKTVGTQDPKRLEFLSENCPEVMDFLKTRITDGQNAIQNGELASSGHSDYDVSFSGNHYEINNQDTAWYRNDWNDFSVSTGDMATGLSDGLRALQDASPASETETGSVPPTSTTEVPASGV